MLEVGERVPNAEVWTARRERRTVDELVAERPALFLFYLFDWSSTWTNEMELLRDRSREFEDAGVSTFAVSRDSPWTHIAWAQALDLNFPLLSDWNGDAVDAFGVAHDFNGMRGVAERTAFLVGTDGTVRGAWRYAASEVPDFDVLLSAARAL